MHASTNMTDAPTFAILTEVWLLTIESLLSNDIVDMLYSDNGVYTQFCYDTIWQ